MKMNEKWPCYFLVNEIILITFIIFGRSSSTEFMMHLSTLGSFRGHTFMYEAVTKKKQVSKLVFIDKTDLFTRDMGSENLLSF